MEQARGIGGNNIVSVLMQEKNIELQAASDLIGQHFEALITRRRKHRRSGTQILVITTEPLYRKVEA